jgi:hypothetical protein
MEKMNTFIEMNMYGDQGHGGNQGHEYVQISGEDDGDGDVFNQIKSQRTKQQREHLEKNQSNFLFNIKNLFGVGSSSKASARLTMDQVNLSYYERPVGVPLDYKLDDFFKDFYEHFYHKGFNAILASEICNLATLLFTVIFSTFLLLCVDYIGLMECTSQDCKELPHYISTSVVKQLWRWDPPNLFSAIIAGYFVLFMAYWMFSLFGFVSRVKKAHRMKQMYNDALGITTRDIQTIRWDNVVNRFIAMQKKNGVQDTLTAHHIASRILRKENYMIALINKNILDLSLPLPFLRERIMLTKGLEFNLNACIFWGMFSRDDSIRKVSQFRRCFVFCASH